MEEALISAISLVIGLFVGSFLTAYMKRKGENLATHEDIDKLVDQVKAVTQTAKEIESKISDELWQRQRRWELRRDALFAVAKATGEMQQAITTFHATKTAISPENRVAMHEQITAAMNALSATGAQADAAAVQALLVCSGEVTDAFRAAIKLMRSLTSQLLEGDVSEFKESIRPIVNANQNVISSIRKELEKV